MTDQIISSEGYEKLQKELDHLSTVKRREIAERIESAKELGDLSENTEYQDAKEAQAFNEGRIAELKNLLKNLTIVSNGGNGDSVGMGSSVYVSVNGQQKKYLIVSFNEVDPAEGKISNESPLGRSFIGKKVGDTINVTTPRGELDYETTKIE